MRVRTTRYSIALTIHAVNVVNKPQDIEWSSAKNTSAKDVKNQLQDTIGGAAAKKALTNKDQNQESPKKISIYEINPHSIASSFIFLIKFSYLCP